MTLARSAASLTASRTLGSVKGSSFWFMTMTRWTTPSTSKGFSALLALSRATAGASSPSVMSTGPDTSDDSSAVGSLMTDCRMPSR